MDDVNRLTSLSYSFLLSDPLEDPARFQNSIFVIDEAHNLPKFFMENYSIDFDYKFFRRGFKELFKFLPILPELDVKDKYNLINELKKLRYIYKKIQLIEQNFHSSLFASPQQIEDEMRNFKSFVLHIDIQIEFPLSVWLLLNQGKERPFITRIGVKLMELFPVL